MNSTCQSPIKGFITTICKTLSKFKNVIFRKWAKDLNAIQRRYMHGKYVYEKMFNSIIRKIEIKTAVGCYYALTCRA